MTAFNRISPRRNKPMPHCVTYNEDAGQALLPTDGYAQKLDNKHNPTLTQL